MDAPTIDISGLYLSEQRRLVRLIGRIVGSGTQADDLVHQAFEKLIRVAGKGELENLPAYLTVTARNLAINHLRDVGRRREVSLPDEVLHGIADRSPSPEMQAIYRFELRRLLAAVAALPPRRREAFVLNKFEGLSYDEIAARQGVSRNTVISHIVLALADLDRQIGQG